MITGQVTLNGISDIELIHILEAKSKHEGRFSFNPQQLQLTSQSQGGKVVPRYNNAILSWNSDEGGKIVLDLLRRLLHEAASAPGQQSAA
jgi:hypothetical protein